MQICIFSHPSMVILELIPGDTKWERELYKLQVSHMTFLQNVELLFLIFFFLDHAGLQNRHSDKRWQCSVLELLVPLTLLSRKRRMQPSCPSSVAALDKRAWRGEGGSNNEVSALHSSSSSHCLHCHGNNQNCCRGNRLFISKIVSSCPKLNCR